MEIILSVCKHYTNGFLASRWMLTDAKTFPSLSSKRWTQMPASACGLPKYKVKYGAGHFKEERAVWHCARKARCTAEWTPKRPIHVRSFLPVTSVVCPCLASSSQPFYLLVLKKVTPSLPFANILCGKPPRKKKKRKEIAPEG